MAKVILSFFILLSISLLVGSAYINHILDKEVYDGKTQVEFRIPQGATAKEISQILKAHNLNLSYTHFKIASRWLKTDQKIRHGRFVLPLDKTLSTRELLTLLTADGVMDLLVTIPEGFNLRQIAKMVADKLEIPAETFLKATKDSALLAKYQIKSQDFEGYLYPETYNFDDKATAEKVIETMHQTFLKKIAPLQADINLSHLTMHQIMTLASIVQGETKILKEADIISALYQNRLKIDMPLQADPTVQYLLDSPRRLYFKDLQIDNKYNTYKYAGLPPGPINNPSIEMVKAVLKPAKVNYLYMVAKGNGEHYFNRSYGDHLKSKKKFDMVRDKVTQEQGSDSLTIAL